MNEDKYNGWNDDGGLQPIENAPFVVVARNSAIMDLKRRLLIRNREPMQIWKFQREIYFGANANHAVL